MSCPSHFCYLLAKMGFVKVEVSLPYPEIFVTVSILCMLQHLERYYQIPFALIKEALVLAPHCWKLVVFNGRRADFGL